MIELKNIAAIMEKGYIDDHIEVRRAYDLKGSSQVIATCGLYEIIHRANFTNAPIPRIFYEGSDSVMEDGSRYFDAAARSRRVWEVKNILDQNLSKEEALLKAKKEAKERNLPLYLRNEDAIRTITLMQKPDGWEPHWG